MKSRHWIYLGLFVALITIFAVPIYLYNRPLDPPLELNPPAAAAGSASEPAQAQPIKIAAQSSNDEPSDGTCGETGLVKVLYLGQNLPETTYRGADAIRLMFVNYETPSIAILSMPPDILVDITEIEEIDPSTLTYAFWYEKQPPPTGERAAVRKATEVVAQALLDNFLYNTEKYMTMNQPVFGKMVDDLGGIDVYIEEAVDGASEGYGYYPQGWYYDMDGQEALDYVRMLAPTPQLLPEWARFNRQNEVVQGISVEVLKIEQLDKLPALISDFYSLLVTDLKPKELRSIFCLLHEVDEESTLFLDVPEEWLSPNVHGVLFPESDDDIATLLKQMEDWTRTGVEPEILPEPE